MKLITRQSVEATRAKEPKRICFSTTHNMQPKPEADSGYVGAFNVPFGEGFARIFPYSLFPNPHREESKWRSIRTEEEFEKIKAWVKHQGDRVFLRDCLNVSIAISHNRTGTGEGGERSEIGELEYRAKHQHDTEAIKTLAEHCVNTIQDLPLYKDADLVCAVPPGPGKDFDLPSRVVSLVSGKVGKPDITDCFNFGSEKKPLKSAGLNEKWEAWEAAQLSFNGSDITGKKIILIDDKYQSGTTIQYIAMKLGEAGARQVYGLSMVKTMRDTDNQ